MKLPSATKLGVTGAIALIIGQATYWLLTRGLALLVILAGFAALILLGFIPIDIPLE